MEMGRGAMRIFGDNIISDRHLWRQFSVFRLFPTGSPQTSESPYFFSVPECVVPKIEVYSTAVCPYCVSAKNLLKSKGLEWSEVRIDTDPAQRETMLARSGGRRTVPQIFINGHHVGGFDDLVAADRSGKLAELLEANA
jgi:glutaredoxin 3